MQVFANTRKFEGNKQKVVEWKTQITQLQSSISYLELSNGAGEKEEKKELFTYKQTIVINYCVQTFIISTGEWTTFSHAAALCVHVVTVVVPWAQQQATGQDVCVSVFVCWPPLPLSGLKTARSNNHHHRKTKTKKKKRSQGGGKCDFLPLITFLLKKRTG